MANHRTPTVVAVFSLIVAVVAIFALIFVQGGGRGVKVTEETGLKVPPAGGPKPVEMVIEDEDAATWIVINNTFNKPLDWDPLRGYWSGVLFQLGEYTPWNGGPSSILDEVCIISTGSGKTCYANQEFVDSEMWINIVNRGNEQYPSEEPVTVNELDYLFLLDDDGKPKSFHKYFIPYRGGITLWANRLRGWDLEAEPVGQHNRFTFSWSPELQQKVEVWRDRGAEPESVWTDVHRITVTYQEGPQHGNQKNPPQKP
jgi:hypothetical protein